MWLMLLGIAVISIPVIVSWSVVQQILGLGSLDGTLIAQALESSDRASVALLCLTRAPRSVPARLLNAQGEIALSEEVSDIERELSLSTRVPRVAASLATSAGLLAASLVFRSSVKDIVPGQLEAALTPALTLAIVAFLGGILCAVLHGEARRMRRRRLAELDALASKLATLPNEAS